MTAIRSAPSPLVFDGRSALIRSNSTVIRASLSSTWGSMGETAGGGRLADVCGPAWTWEGRFSLLLFLYHSLSTVLSLFVMTPIRYYSNPVRKIWVPPPPPPPPPPRNLFFLLFLYHSLSTVLSLFVMTPVRYYSNPVLNFSEQVTIPLRTYHPQLILLSVLNGLNRGALA